MSQFDNLSISLRPNGPTLAYSLHRPTGSPSHPVKLALIAHPLGRLGGCREDHVVTSLSEMLVHQGWTLCRYDSRGAGESGGRASWTSLAEADDYRKMFELVLAPLAPSTGEKTRVLLAGYSAGSLGASSFLSSPTTLEPTPFSLEYLLISYPLSVLPFLTLFHSSAFHDALNDLVRSGAAVLAIHGDGDQFTGVESYRSWAEGLEGGHTKWKAVQVEEADHFWRSSAAKRRLLDEVSSWLARGGP